MDLEALPDVPLPNDKDLRRRYGIGLPEYLELLEAQGLGCAICAKPPTARTGPLVVDHDHDTLTIDGLVHGSPCNRRLIQQVRRYLADPPGRRFGWTVPPDLEARTIERRELGKEKRRAAKKAHDDRVTATVSRITAEHAPEPVTALRETREGTYSERTREALAVSERYNREEAERLERERRARARQARLERERAEREAEQERERRSHRRRLRIPFRTGD